MKPPKKFAHFKKHALHVIASSFWFIFGFVFAGLLLLSILVIYFEANYNDKVYPGVYIDNISVGEKTIEEIEIILNQKNSVIEKHKFALSLEDNYATVSAKEINIGYNSKLLAEQVYSIGRSENIITNAFLIINSYLNGTHLFSSYTFDTDKLHQILKPINDLVYKEPIDALFSVQEGRVIAFKQSSDGKSINTALLEEEIRSTIPRLVASNTPDTIHISIPITILKPQKTTEQANNLGIVEVLGEGKSYFVGSIPNRVHNVTLAASRINGVLIAPGEAFSFVKAIGDISKFTGYKEAYVIVSGKTVLGDGGGVCQVSTTLFRAVLDSGLPIAERHAHAYRVGYYEQNFPPGLDATVYVPSVDFKFKNDTKNHILIQSFLNPSEMSLTFTFYGKSDGRQVTVTDPIVTNRTPPPEPRNQDDPTLPRGTVKQVEYAAAGATVSFERVVKLNGKLLYNDKFNSRYTPWQAVFLQGTKDG